jgi:hypothetical protein
MNSLLSSFLHSTDIPEKLLFLVFIVSTFKAINGDYKCRRYYHAMTLRVAYTDFWAGFEPSKSILTKILEKASGSDTVIVDSNSKSIDVEFRSVFTFHSKAQKALTYGLGQVRKTIWDDYLNRAEYGYSLRRKKNAKVVIWYTGENIRFPRGVFDLTLSYDQTDFAATNFYFPVWYLKMDWFKNLDPDLGLYDLDSFLSHRDLGSRPHKACAFSSSKESSRMSLYKTVESVMALDKYGSGWNRWVNNKHQVAQAYGFQVCPENDLYPGYVTEKLFDAYSSGNIPIWRGLDSTSVINQSAVLDLTLLSVGESIEKLRGLSEADTIFMRNQPLLTTRPSIQPVIAKLTEILSRAI